MRWRTKVRGTELPARTVATNLCFAEMITHLAMFSHAKPENVLIVGGTCPALSCLAALHCQAHRLPATLHTGGDGGVIREVVKHKSVKHITICEIDKVRCTTCS